MNSNSYLLINDKTNRALPIVLTEDQKRLIYFLNQYLLVKDSILVYPINGEAKPV